MPPLREERCCKVARALKGPQLPEHCSDPGRKNKKWRENRKNGGKQEKNGGKIRKEKKEGKQEKMEEKTESQNDFFNKIELIELIVSKMIY